MKGPWESIAVGLEKGHKTQKLEKVANHASKRVGDGLACCLVVGLLEESEGRP